VVRICAFVFASSANIGVNIVNHEDILDSRTLISNRSPVGPL
jgi:hypothetical protein